MANRMRWRARSNTATKQFVYRSHDPFDMDNLPEPLAMVAPDVEEYVDAEALAGVHYYYVIGATNGSVMKYSPVYFATGDKVDLGPGPQTLIGHNETAGFLGEVTSSQLISGTGLANLLGITEGTVQNDTSPWLKFFRHDKIIFVSKKNFRHSITWDHLQAANAVDGSRIITLHGYDFRVRLLGGLNPVDPGIAYANGYDTPWTHDSEWNDLLYFVSQEQTNPAYNKVSQVGDNWANYPQDDSTNGLNITAGNGRYSWCQETSPARDDYRVHRGYYAVSSVNTSLSSYVYSSRGWRAALELVTL